MVISLWSFVFVGWNGKRLMSLITYKCSPFYTCRDKGKICHKGKDLQSLPACLGLFGVFSPHRRTTEMLKLVGTSQNHLVHQSCSSRDTWSRLPRSMLSQIFSSSTDKDYKTSLGNLFQLLITFTVNKAFFSCSEELSCVLICTYYFLYYDWAPLRRTCLLLLHLLSQKVRLLRIHVCYLLLLALILVPIDADEN